MSSPLDAGTRVALNRPRIAGLVAATVVLEAGARAGLSLIHPALSVLLPPVIGVLLLGGALPAVRTVVDDPEAALELRLRERWSTDGPRLVAVAVVGHALALAAGAAVFLLLDTPIRYAWYASGRSVPLVVAYGAPLVTVAAAAVLAWGLLVPVVSRAVDDDEALRPVRTVVAALADRRTTGVRLALQFATGVAIVAGLVVGLVLTRGAASAAVGLPVVSAIVLPIAAVVGLFSYPIHAGLPTPASTGRARPGLRTAVVVLVLVGLLVGASTVRVTETRPTASPEPLPEDPGAAYETAAENALEADHRIRTRRTDGDGRTFRWRRAVDRTDRQVLFGRGENVTAYASTGVAWGVYVDRREAFSLGERPVEGERTVATAVPGYFDAMEGGPFGGPTALPEPGNGTWRRVDRSNGTVTVALTDGDAVARATVGGPVDEYRTARIEMAIDADRGVVTGGTARVNASRDGNRIDLRWRYAVESGPAIDVRRPEALGPPSPGEWVWRLFAY